MQDLSGAKAKDLKKALRDLTKMLDNVSANSPKRAEVIRNSIDKVQKKLQEVTGATGKFGATHSSIWRTAVRNISTYMGVFAAFNFAKTKIQEMIKTMFYLKNYVN
jgi:ElaB/YqjD/DUF883 family membrane-anchored ribosome-binding protein